MTMKNVRFPLILSNCFVDHSHLVRKRPKYYSSRSLSQSLDAALHNSRLLKEDIDSFDFNSYGDTPSLILDFANKELNRCFPIVPKLGCKHLSLPQVGSAKPITLLGGLTSFGGAGNNYSLHVCNFAPLIDCSL
jgi:hypothetical protein